VEIHPKLSVFLVELQRRASVEIKAYKRVPPFPTLLTMTEWDASAELREASPRARPRGTDEYPFSMPILWRGCNPQAEASGASLEARLAAE